MLAIVASCHGQTGAIFFMMNESDMQAALKSPLVSVCTDSGARAIEMTGLPAANVGLKQRGLIREGYFADITIFDPKTVIDRATFEEPNQYPVGINFVMVSGQIEVDKGQRTPALAGRVLRGPGYR